jgi:hypothetical protein
VSQQTPILQRSYVLGLERVLGGQHLIFQKFVKFPGFSDKAEQSQLARIVFQKSILDLTWSSRVA